MGRQRAAGLVDLSLFVVLSAVNYGFYAAAGLGRNPLLAVAVLLGSSVVGIAMMLTRMSPVMRTEGAVRLWAFIKADIAADGDLWWEKWWNPMSKRSLTKWLAGCDLICLFIGLVFVHPFVSLVLYQMWVLLLLPVFLCHRVLRQRTHTIGSSSASRLFGFGVVGAVIVALSQYVKVEAEHSPFGVSYIIGLGFILLGVFIASGTAHHAPCARQLLAQLDDDDALLAESRTVVGGEHAHERASTMMCVAAVGVSRAVSAICGLALLVVFSLGNWSLLPTESLSIGGVLLLLVGMPITYGLSSFFWFRGLKRATQIPVQSVQFFLPPVIVLSTIGFGSLSNIFGEYWFAPLQGVSEINVVLLSIGLAIIVGINILINIQLTKQKTAETAAR